MLNFIRREAATVDATNPKKSLRERGFTMLELLIAGVLLIIIIGVAVTQLLGKQNSEYRNQAAQVIGTDIPNALTTYYQQHQRTYTGFNLAYLTANGFADQNGNFAMPCSGADVIVAGSVTVPTAQSVQIIYPFANCKSGATMAADIVSIVCPTATTCSPLVTSAAVSGTTNVTVVYSNPK